jgi:hypothetical protein
MGLVVVVASCQSNDASERPETPKPQKSPPEQLGKHWIQDERLRAVMADVAQRMRDHYPSGLPSDPEQPTPPAISRAFADASMLADALAKGAERIPHAIEGNNRISPEDRAGFLQEASTLREHALQLKTAADERRLEGMQRSLLGINATCIGCHSKYKDISGEIDFPKSARALAAPAEAVARAIAR